MITFGTMLVPGRFPSGVQSSKAPTWAAGSAGSLLSEEPKDDEAMNMVEPEDNGKDDDKKEAFEVQ